MRKALTAVAAAAALAAPVANAAQIAKKKPLHKKRVVTVKKKVVGAMGNAGQWGQVEITLLVKKTTTILGKKKTVKRKIVDVGVPIYPNHTGRSIFINEQALPYLRHEVLQAQFNANIYLISGATYTSYAFVQSLQAALLKAEHV
jgi:uncharacterized protein with FMN-binding domain